MRSVNPKRSFRLTMVLMKVHLVWSGIWKRTFTQFTKKEADLLLQE